MPKRIIMTEKQVRNIGELDGSPCFWSKERMERLIEDTKVLGSASVAVLVDYFQVFNAFLTVLISICTLIYVGNRAWEVLTGNWNRSKKKGKKNGTKRRKKQ